MANSLELANEILRCEKRLTALYSQLENSFSDRSRYSRIVQDLETLQYRQIKVLNNLVDALEEEQPPPPTRRYYAQHILQPGETLAVLALEYNTTIAEIRRYNPTLPDDPEPGQVVDLPIEIPKPPQDSFRYVVKPGDTLVQLSQRFNTNISTLVRLNNIANPDIIFPGRILIIPSI
jgi:LysM repeat protein